MDRLTDLDGAVVRLLLTRDHAEQSGFSGAVGTDHADDAAGRQFECQIVDQQIVAKAFGQMIKVDNVL